MNPDKANSKNNIERVTIDLDGLRLEQTENDYLPGLRAFEHQIESDRLIKENKSLFLFNHSPTGSGKTISWLNPLLDEKMRSSQSIRQMPW